MDLSLYITYWPLLFKGLLFTLYICSIGVFLAMLGGLILYRINRINFLITRLVYSVYLTVFRGTPLLVQVYLVYYGGPFIGLELTAEQVGILGLAYMVQLTLLKYSVQV